MTAPSITYGHGYLEDFASVTDWTLQLGGATGTMTSTGDYAKVDITADPGESYIIHTADLGLSPILYPKICWRYRCSNSNIKAQIIILDHNSHPQTVLPETNSTTFTKGSATINFGDADVLDHILLYANDAIGYVYYDLALVYSGEFTFPNIGGGDLIFDPPTRYALLGIPGRITDLTQHLGASSATVTCSCDLDIEQTSLTWKRPQTTIPKTDVINGQIFLEIDHNQNRTINPEPWQWLNTGQGMQLKVTTYPQFHYAQNGRHQVDLDFTEYSLGNKGEESYIERFGLNL